MTAVPSDQHRFVTGAGRYVDDIRPGTAAVEVAFLRSPHASARITAIDAADALALDGVLRVVTGADLSNVPALPVTRPHPGLRLAVGPAALARDEVKYVGEPVIAVAAANRYVAEDALERIVVEYEPHAAAVLPGAAPHVHAGAASNEAGQFVRTRGDVRGALAGSAHKIAISCTLARGAAQPMETRGVVADWINSELTVWWPTQRPHGVRAFLASYLGLDPSRIVVHAPDIGGAFGSKAYFYPEEFVVVWLARDLGRAVRWTEDRAEHFLSTYPEHETRFSIEAGCDAYGRLTALAVDLTIDLGAYAPYGFAVAQNASDHCLGAYVVPTFEITARGTYTNKIPGATYRGAGRPQGIFAVERALDALADESGTDRVEIRRRNLIGPEQMPYRTGLHPPPPAREIVHDSGDYPACMAKALTLLNLAKWRAEQTAVRNTRHRLGIGLANYIECSLARPWERARVRLCTDGTVEVLVGVSSQGQSHAQTLARVAAHALGVPESRVIVRAGSTLNVSDSIGTYGSRVAIMAGNAVRLAAEQLRRTGATEVEASFECEDWQVSYGTCIAVVEIDTVTGAIAVRDYVQSHDIGVVLNQTAVDGQTRGGFAQGLGGSLYERLQYDEQGQPTVATFMDYLIPTAAEVPDIAMAHCVSASPTNPLGVKGAGEGGIMAAYPVLAAAIEDALGVRISSMPVTAAHIRAFGSRSAA